MKFFPSSVGPVPRPTVLGKHTKTEKHLDEILPVRSPIQDYEIVDLTDLDCLASIYRSYRVHDIREIAYSYYHDHPLSSC